MKKWKTIPPRSVGDVGDTAYVVGRTYEKAGNGKWGLVIDRKLVADVRECYVVKGMTLREVASALSTGPHKLASSKIQRIVDNNGWMRSHYGRKNSALLYLQKNKKKIVRLYEDHACTLRELVYITGVHGATISEFFNKLLGEAYEHSGGMRPIKNRLESVGGVHPKTIVVWNRLLSLDENSLTFREYKGAIRSLTNLMYERFFPDDHIRRTRATHADHILSIRNGFYRRVGSEWEERQRKVPLRYMAHPENMRLIPREVNLAKGDLSNHTPKQLIAKANKSKIQLIVLNRRKELQSLSRSIGLKSHEE